MKDVECAKINEKSIFRFLLSSVFKIWSFLYSKLTITQKINIL